MKNPSVFDPELSSTAVAETRLSELDGDTGALRIRGYSIEDIASSATYEEAAWLLFDGRLPTEDELTEFSADLTSLQTLPEEVHAVIEASAREEVPAMDVLRVALAAGQLGVDGDPLVTAQRVVAICPTIVAAYWRRRQGLEPIQPGQDRSHAANFLYMLTGDEPTAETVEGLETYLTTIVEHGVNPSTFTARIVGSTGADPLSAATGAVGTLKGPRHGGAIELTFELLTTVDEGADPRNCVEETIDAEGSLPGFGHSVYDARDPRADILADATESIYAERESTFLTTARELEAVATEYFAEHYPERQLHVNVDFYAAVLLHGLEIPSELFSTVFAVGRSAGWMAHYLEQLESEALVRPRTRYVGPGVRPWLPREDRYVAGESAHPSPDALEGVASVMSTLSEPSRLELLLLLADADEPLSYSTMRTRSSIEDKGRFNYHLRKLRGPFVTKTDDGYTLTDAGRQVVETLLADDDLHGQWFA